MEGGPDGNDADVATSTMGAGSSSSAGYASIAVGGHSTKKSRSSSGGDTDTATQVEFPPNIIQRTVPSKMMSTDPAQCMATIDRMYHVYYELEVHSAAVLWVLDL